MSLTYKFLPKRAFKIHVLPLRFTFEMLSRFRFLTLLLAGLVALDVWVLEPSLSPLLGHVALLSIGAAGVVTFSIVILARLGELHEREIAQSRRLQALNEAGLALSAELETETLLHKIADLAR